MNNEVITLADTRRLNLTRLLNEKFEGNQARMARAITCAPDYIWRVLNKQKGFGETLSKKIEQALKLPEGWMSDARNSTREGGIPTAGSQIVVVQPHAEDRSDGGEEGHPVRTSILTRYGVELSRAAMVVMGDQSMSMSLPQGELVLINQAATLPIDGKLFYLQHGRVKKIRRLMQEGSGEWALRCDTQDKMRFPDLTQVREADMEIIGQVFWSAGSR